MVLKYSFVSREVQKPDKKQIKVDTEHSTVSDSTTFDEALEPVWLKIKRGHELCRDGKLVEAIVAYSEVVNEEDVKPMFKQVAFMSRGIVLEHLKKLEEAYNDFSKVLKVYSQYRTVIRAHL